MMAVYLQWVKANPLFSAAVQFAILGTLGEVLSTSLARRKLGLPGSSYQTLGKVFAWALLGLVIKAGFIGMRGFTDALKEHGMLPALLASGPGYAFALSVFTNVFFGPQMMLFHRIEDNFILGEWKFDGIQKAWWTLLWFWIPAHTVTFLMERDLQIGLAAVWSLALGLILGLSKGGKAGK